MFDAVPPAKHAVPAAPSRGTTTPGWLRRIAVLLTLLTVLAGGLSLWAATSIHATVRTIGRDAEPSVGLALRLADTLSTMDAAVLADSLTDAGAAAGTSLVFRTATLSLAADLVDAARNVTYGEAEAEPLRELLRWALAYQEAVAEARTLGQGNAWITAHRLRWARRVNRDFAAPQAAALATANADVLEAEYAAYRSGSLLRGAAAFGAFAVLVLTLVAAQLWLLRRMRRLLNLPMAAATVIAAAAGLWFGVAVLTERANLRAAKADAYDSLHVLFEAKGAVSSLRADMSMWLLDPDPDNRAAAQADMDQTARRLIETNLGDPAQAAATLRTLNQALTMERAGQATQALAAVPHMGGLLGTEFDNITFGVDERQPATSSVERLVDALALMRALQAQETRRDHTMAIVRWLGRQTGQGDAVFSALETALDQTIAINQAEFDRRVTSSLATAAIMPFVSSGGLLATLLLALAGLWQRLREYR